MALTGRKFKCIGLRQCEVLSWKNNFKIDEIYNEANQGYGLSENVLYLESDFKHKNKAIAYYVDADQFELIKE